MGSKEKKINWKSVLFRCHCMGDLLTEARDAKKKAAGEFGSTAITRLKKIYVLERWGREEILKTDAITKGVLQEQLGIDLINLVEGEKFVKNEERIESDILSGIPDFFKGKEIRKAKFIGDNKCSESATSFIEKEEEPGEIEKLSKQNEAQLNCYFLLSGAQEGAIYHTLVDAPEETIQKKISKLRYEMGVIDDTVNADFQHEVALIKHNHIFSDIPEKERVIKIFAKADNKLIEKIESVVKKGREWLAEFDDKRLSRYK